MAYVSDIKLIRTDTTLDLSQKAEKGMVSNDLGLGFYKSLALVIFVSQAMWDARLVLPSLLMFIPCLVQIIRNAPVIRILS